MSRYEARTFIDGALVEGGEPTVVTEPYRGEAIIQVWQGTREVVDRAVGAARTAWQGYQRMPAHQRKRILQRAAEAVAARADEFTRLMVEASGKCWKDAAGEVAHSVTILELSAEEAARVDGQLVPMDAAPAGEGRVAFTIRLPVGVIAAITPFNAPLSVTLNKVGPAFAAGNCVLHKPDLRGSVVAVRLAALFLEAGLPPGVLNVVHGDAATGELLVSHPGVDLINFTGSEAVAQRILSIAGLKRMVMELGGTGATIVHADAAIDTAAAMCVPAAFGLTGQSCVSVQRLYVQRRVVQPFLDRFLPKVRALNVGDPMDPQTDIGPMISEAAAARVERWISEAVAGGATLLCGGHRRGTFLEPTVLAGVRPDMKLVCAEVFGPVVSVLPYETVDEAFTQVNDSPYGLQIGIFTGSLDLALRAARELRAGTVIVNGPSRWRVDHMPYGGVKRSGWGREGPRYSVEDMTELHLVVLGPTHP